MPALTDRSFVLLTFTHRDLQAFMCRRAKSLAISQTILRAANLAATTPRYFVKVRKQKREKNIAAVLRDGVRAIIRQRVADVDN